MTAAAKRVLVVEDEALIALLLEDMLQDLGHAVVGPALRLEEGLRLAASAEFDLAVLDVNLGGQPSTPIARALEARGIPFLFATGYGAEGLLPEYRRSGLLRKPFTQGDLAKGLAQALAEG